ncbi:MAG: signal peptidase I [Chloroflexus sp.]|jgi:signal peptidase I|uniref:Signal peptidase I n=1 Tax=Chloroflexus aurantiacus (strain ATCC 29366 / DSM 635 / J-10-fl) TaxID=324602 RepID=A9WK59_CHLAA|nr:MULTISPECIES: signal peptidase I [Chloroflexus]ABY34510.1 signal peptidase I [Chloroflexus aurantiacus J-10-fl]RMG47349.1 MAG: signal peptidase I [Chloroflexota bacterium]GIV87258.1 MAG: signal peptidase I [Chloroflexus sp.]HBW66546.1 signal peptidase I [Chloroflexus aurantiacus]
MTNSPSSSEPLTSDPETVQVRQPRAPLRYVVRELLETAIFILLVFLIVRGVVQNFKIEGSSMEPTLHTGQYILVNKLIYFHFDLNAPLRLLPGQSDLPPRIVYPFRPPQRGDIVVFEYPRDVRKDYIKRVIGLPGDIIEIREGKVFVNNEPLDEPYLRGASTYCLGGYPCAQGPVLVPAGSIFVMGDNRGNSSDSREWDALPLDRVVGQAWLIYFPFSDWGLVPHHRYETSTAVAP